MRTLKLDFNSVGLSLLLLNITYFYTIYSAYGFSTLISSQVLPTAPPIFKDKQIEEMNKQNIYGHEISLECEKCVSKDSFTNENWLNQNENY